MTRWRRLVSQYLEAHRAGWAAGTIARSQRWLEKFMLWCGTQRLSAPAQVTAAHIAEYRQFLLCVPGLRAKFYTLNSVAQALTVVRHFFQWATARGHLLINPAQALLLPRIDTRPPQLTVAQVERVLAIAENDGTAAGLRDRAVLETLYRAAVRRNECLHLTLADLDLARRTLRVVGRGGHERQVPVPAALGVALARYLDASRPQLVCNETSALFLSTAGTPFNGWALTMMLRRVSKRASVHVTAHVLRHARAAHMFEEGATIDEVQVLLGHRVRQSTRIAYADAARATRDHQRRKAQQQRPLTHFHSLVDGSDEDWSAILDE